LAETFAGNARVICPGEQGVYDPDTDTYAQVAATDVPVKFIQETMKRNVLTHVGGVQIEAGDLVGVIPAYQITNPLRRRVDRFRRNGIDYTIESTEEISSGDKTSLIRILCKRS
jgi:hypothetical protein